MNSCSLTSDTVKPNQPSRKLNFHWHTNAGRARNPHPGPLPAGEGGTNNSFYCCYQAVRHYCISWLSLSRSTIFSLRSSEAVDTNIQHSALLEDEKEGGQG